MHKHQKTYTNTRKHRQILKKHTKTPENIHKHQKTYTNIKKHTKTPENIHKHQKTYPNTKRTFFHFLTMHPWQNLMENNRAMLACLLKQLLVEKEEREGELKKRLVGLPFVLERSLVDPGLIAQQSEFCFGF